MPTNPHICYAVSCKRSPPGAPPACSRAPALPIPTVPDRPETSADMLLKVALEIALSFALTLAPSFAMKIPPAPTPAPPPSCPPPESPQNNAVSALGSPQYPPQMADLGGYPRNLSRSPIVSILHKFRQAKTGVSPNRTAQ